MDNNIIASDMIELNEQLAVMNANGQNITKEELIMDTILRGIQAIFDEKLEGRYYTVKKEADDFLIFDFINKEAGSLTNQQFNFVFSFENQSLMLWDQLEREIVKMLGR